jgi:hypothetical protein
MHVKMNGESADMQIALKRHDPQPSDQNLYADGMRVARVTHSRSDEIPVIIVLDNEAVVEIEPQAFYAIDGMHHDWQPGTQPDGLAVG